MTVETYTKRVQDLSNKADTAIEALEETAKNARSEQVQSALSERKNNVSNRLRTDLETLETLFLGRPIGWKETKDKNTEEPEMAEE